MLGCEAYSVLVLEDFVRARGAAIALLAAVVLVGTSACTYMTPQSTVKISNVSEGINATVKLERPDVPAWSRHVWLDQIVRVEHLDSTMASEN